MAKPFIAEKRTRWSAAEASAVLTELERSGLSVQEFARREGLQPERLYRWRQRLEEAAGGAGGIEFVEVRAAEIDSFAPLEIVLRSGHRVLVRGAVDVAVLRTVVLTLEGEC
jgi:transposase-like protein